MSKVKSPVPVVLARVPMRLRLYMNAPFLIGDQGSICWLKCVSDSMKHGGWLPLTLYSSRI